MDKVIVTKAKLDELARCINEKAGTTQPLTLAQMQQAVSQLNVCQSVEELRWHQCPAKMREFLEQVHYGPEEEESQIDGYAPEQAEPRHWQAVAGQVGENTFYHPVPGQDTLYFDGKAHGVVRPLDPVRLIHTEAANVRDLGGWACDGGTVDYGLLFRGAAPSAQDQAVMEELGVIHQLDLRGGDLDRETDLRLTCPEGIEAYLPEESAGWKQALHCVFDGVIHKEPVYFHGETGVDRTGTLACILLGILGVSRWDIEKEYELSCFYTGTTDQAPRRSAEGWKKLMAFLQDLPGDNFRDKCICYVLRLGFPLETVDAFRSNMIDGTAEKVAMELEHYTVSETLDPGVSMEANGQQVLQYSCYKAEVRCQENTVIDCVQVRMDGVDITQQVWQGRQTDLRWKVRLNLFGCTSSNDCAEVFDGQSYCTTISAIEDYTMDGAAVKIIMGGEDMTKYYSGGTIAIEKVTGNVEVMVTAVDTTITWANRMVVSEGNLNKRLYSLGAVESYNGVFICDPIEVDLQSDCPIIFKGFGEKLEAFYSDSDYNFGQSRLMLLDSDKQILALWYLSKNMATGRWAISISNGDCSGNLSSVLNTNPINGTKPSKEDVAYVQFSFQISKNALTREDLAGLQIQLT